MSGWRQEKEREKSRDEGAGQGAGGLPTPHLLAQPACSLWPFGKMTCPWEVTVPMAPSVLLSPGDRRAPAGEAGGWRGWGGTCEGPRGAGDPQTYVRAPRAGRRAGRARAAPGGTQRRCRRCTPGAPPGEASVRAGGVASAWGGTRDPCPPSPLPPARPWRGAPQR